MASSNEDSNAMVQCVSNSKERLISYEGLYFYDDNEKYDREKKKIDKSHRVNWWYWFIFWCK